MPSNLIFHDVKQGTDEWKQLKAGKFGGTSASTFLVKGKNENEIGSGLDSMIYAKAGECIEGPDLDSYSSKEMERGNLYEPYARSAYEAEEFSIVKEIGYIQMGDYLGVSPDGLVGEDGGVEIKCLEMKAFIRWMTLLHEAKTTVDALKLVPKPYFAQMQWLMFVTGRKWVDYVVYHPHFRLSILKVVRDESAIAVFKKKSKWVESRMDQVLNIADQNALKSIAA